MSFRMLHYDLPKYEPSANKKHKDGKGNKTDKTIVTKIDVLLVSENGTEYMSHNKRETTISRDDAMNEHLATYQSFLRAINRRLALINLDALKHDINYEDKEREYVDYCHSRDICEFKIKEKTRRLRNRALDTMRQIIEYKFMIGVLDEESDLYYQKNIYELKMKIAEIRNELTMDKYIQEAREGMFTYLLIHKHDKTILSNLNYETIVSMAKHSWNLIPKY